MEKNKILAISGGILGAVSIFIYAFYGSWIALVGLGLALILFSIRNKSRYKEFKESAEKQKPWERKLNHFLTILLWILLIINVFMVIRAFQRGDFEGFALLLMLGIFIGYNNLRLP